MLFNSISFLIFLPIVFLLYWFAFKKNLWQQNLLLLVASFFFYACWDYRFLFLLLFSIFLDFFSGIQMFYAKSLNKKRFWFWLSILINLGFLGVFKYYNFFAASFAAGLSTLGVNINIWTLKVILPVGISFYTFHGLSYVIDIYKNRIEPERNFVDYAVFVSFFPLLVAGPIERATHLLPQIKKERTFSYYEAVAGLRQILWGLFKKVVIADNCALYANIVFNNPGEYSGSSHVVAAIMFAFQIYGDFSGYSDIAIGTAKLFGINLLRNFSYPYFSRDIAEFWRRWHISLSTWFRDYLYIPLGGNKGGAWIKVRNTFVIFLVSGFWHGANWTFIVWGALNACYIMPSIILNTNRNNLDIVAKNRNLPTFKEISAIAITFALTVFAWIFFRADSVRSAVSFISVIKSKSLFTVPATSGLFTVSIFLIPFILIEWVGREQEFALGALRESNSKLVNYLSYGVLAFSILLFGNFNQNQFIYFQF